MFHVGQKVVCVETWSPSPGTGRGDEIGPIKGRIYTIRALVVHPAHPGPHVLLREIRNDVVSYRSGRYEASFHARRFRHVVGRKTDISIFQQMITPKRADELVAG